MKVIIAGSRDITNYSLVEKAVQESDFTITEVVSGCCRGVDQLGEQWATEHSVSVARFPANWSVHYKAAGPIRNKEMAEYADALIALWDGQSKGTKNMIDTAKKLGLKVFIYAC